MWVSNIADVMMVIKKTIISTLIKLYEYGSSMEKDYMKLISVSDGFNLICGFYHLMVCN